MVEEIRIWYGLGLWCLYFSYIVVVSVVFILVKDNYRTAVIQWQNTSHYAVSSTSRGIRTHKFSGGYWRLIDCNFIVGKRIITCDNRKLLDILSFKNIILWFIYRLILKIRLPKHVAQTFDLKTHVTLRSMSVH